MLDPSQEMDAITKRLRSFETLSNAHKDYGQPATPNQQRTSSGHPHVLRRAQSGGILCKKPPKLKQQFQGIYNGDYQIPVTPNVATANKKANRKNPNRLPTGEPGRDTL